MSESSCEFQSVLFKKVQVRRLQARQECASAVPQLGAF